MSIDEDVGVLVDDRERDGLRLHDIVARPSGTSSSSRAPADTGSRARTTRPAGRQAALRDEPLDVRAREARRVGHEAVGAAAGRALRDLDRDALDVMARGRQPGRAADRRLVTRSPSSAATMSRRMPMLIAASATLNA